MHSTSICNLFGSVHCEEVMYIVSWLCTLQSVGVHCDLVKYTE